MKKLACDIRGGGAEMTPFETKTKSQRELK